MSTCANIAIVLNENDINTTLNFLDKRFDGIRPEITKYPWVECSKEEETFKDIFVKCPVLQIYNHHDGYPDHLLTVLTRYYNNYERALSLILAGDTSCVSKSKTDAYAIHEGYNDNTPLSLMSPKCNECYLYVFENGCWHAYDSNYDNISDILDYPIGD